MSAPVREYEEGGRAAIVWAAISSYARANEIPGNVRVIDDDGRDVTGVDADAERVIFLSDSMKPALTLDQLTAAVEAAGSPGTARLATWHNHDLYRVVDVGYFYSPDDNTIDTFMLQRRWG